MTALAVAAALAVASTLFLPIAAFGVMLRASAHANP
jgi:hypothetical protein